MLVELPLLSASFQIHYLLSPNNKTLHSLVIDTVIN